MPSNFSVEEPTEAANDFICAEILFIPTPLLTIPNISSLNTILGDLALNSSI